MGFMKKDLVIVKPKSFLKSSQMPETSTKVPKQTKEFNNYLQKVDKKMANIVDKSEAKKSLEMLK